MSSPFTIEDMEPADRPHWEALRSGKLLIQQCRACARHYFPATRCGCSPGAEMEWVESAGLGRVHAFAVFHRAYGKHLADEVPYTVLVVELDEGPLIVSRLEAPTGFAPSIDDRMTVDFDIPVDGLATHSFRPTSDGSAPH